MRKIVHIISLVTLIIIGAIPVNGQSKISKSNQKANTIEYVRSIMADKPVEAVRMLNDIIQSSNKKRDVQTISEAYELLGDINAKNELYSDAVKRFIQANDYADISNSAFRITELNKKIGESYLSLQSTKAKSYFHTCIQLSKGDGNYYECYEGYADVLKLQDSIEKSRIIYQEIEEKYKERNNPSLARIQAKIAETYASQLKINEALINYGNAQSNYSETNKKDDAVIKISSENIILNQNNIDDEISIRNSNIDFYSNRPEKVAEEKIQLANAYVRTGKTSSAEALLNEIKPVLKELPISTKADYYKQSSQIENEKGNFETAINQYKEYVRFRDSLLGIREASLDKRLNIFELQSAVDLSEKDYLNERDRIEYQRNLVTRQKYIIGLLGLLLLGAILSSLLIYRNVQAKNKANKLLELRSLRSAMNPHFIFNALGSVNNYIAEKDSRKANKYLSDFSKLMRSVLDMNKQDLVPIKEEIALAELYLKLEHGRWSDKFDYSVNIDLESIPEDIMVPPLLIQPYIENAIWHGLRYKETKGLLQLNGNLLNNKYVLEIIDNGIGRKESKNLKTKNQKLYKSTGIQNTKRRTELINDIYAKNYSVDIQDFDENETDSGTQVRLELN